MEFTVFITGMVEMEVWATDVFWKWSKNSWFEKFDHLHGNERWLLSVSWLMRWLTTHGLAPKSAMCVVFKFFFLCCVSKSKRGTIKQLEVKKIVVTGFAFLFESSSRPVAAAKWVTNGVVLRKIYHGLFEKIRNSLHMAFDNNDNGFRHSCQTFDRQKFLTFWWWGILIQHWSLWWSYLHRIGRFLR